MAKDLLVGSMIPENEAIPCSFSIKSKEKNCDSSLEKL